MFEELRLSIEQENAYLMRGLDEPLPLESNKKEDQNGFRKHYRDGEKVKHDYPYWLEILGVEHDPTPSNYIAALQQTWREDWNIALSQFGPPEDLKPLQKLTCRKGKPLVSREQEWRRTNVVLEDRLMDFVVCDFDGEHPDISTTSSLQKRINVCQKLAPFLEGSGSGRVPLLLGFFENTKEPNRINTHIVVWFDRPYPRATVRAFLQKFAKTENGEKCLDPALSVKTQPHIVANPIFERTKRIIPQGERLLHISGGRLCLDDFDLPTEAPQKNKQRSQKSDLKLSTNSEEKAAQLLRLAEQGS